MEEKKNIKINLSTFFLILAIIAIIIMAFFIYKLNNEKTLTNEKYENLQNQINELNKTLQEQQSNSLEEAIDSNNSSEKDINSNNLNENTNSSEFDSSTEYEITGKYYQESADGDEPFYTFSNNNKVTYGSLFMCNGTYTINNNTIKINFTDAIDPDGNAIEVADCNVSEFVELTIIDNNKLKDNSNGFIYSKK